MACQLTAELGAYRLPRHTRLLLCHAGLLPQPPARAKQHTSFELAATHSKVELKRLTLSMQVPTAIAGARATSNYGMAYESNCGRYSFARAFRKIGQ